MTRFENNDHAFVRPSISPGDILSAIEMKNILHLYFMMYITENVICLEFISSSNKGDYSIIWREIKVCDSSRGTDEIRINLRLNKVKRNETYMTGNITFLQPYGDYMKMDITFLKFHNERGWQHFPLTLTFNKVCSDVRAFMGKSAPKTVGHKNIFATCPIPKGVYVYDLNLEKLMSKNLLPAQFLYGRYKLFCNYIRKSNKELMGCFYVVIEMKPNYKRN